MFFKLIYHRAVFGPEQEAFIEADTKDDVFYIAAGRFPLGNGYSIEPVGVECKRGWPLSACDYPVCRCD